MSAKVTLTTLFILFASLGAKSAQAADLPDFDGNCVADVHDFLAFQNAFIVGHSSADVDGDGKLAIHDFLAFQNAFEAYDHSQPFDGCGTGGEPVVIRSCDSVQYKFNRFTDGDYPAGSDENGDIFAFGGNIRAPQLDDFYLVNFDADITFEFADTYQCGQFANGDWWVHNPDGGAVEITRMTPDFENDRHGFSVDPAINENSLDIRIDAGKYISPATQVADHPHADLIDDRLIIRPSDKPVSILKSVSRNADRDGRNNCEFRLAKSVDDRHTDIAGMNPDELKDFATKRFSYFTKTCLLSAAVLNVLPELPTELTFSPPYVESDDKPMISAAELKVDLLPAFTPTAEIAGDIKSDLNVVQSYFGGRFIDHLSGWTNRYIHPHANLWLYDPRNAGDYGARLSNIMAQGLLRLTLDLPGDKTQLATTMTQIGIDLYHQVLLGQEWGADGGIFMGRKAPILVAGKMLQDTDLGQDMLNIDKTFPTGKSGGNIFSEDDHIYRSPVTDEILFGQGGGFDIWLNECGGSRDGINPDGKRDGGGWEWKFGSLPSDEYPDGMVTVMNTLNLELIEKGQMDRSGVIDEIQLVDKDNPTRYPPIEGRRIYTDHKGNDCNKYKFELPTLQQQIDYGKSYAGIYQNCCASGPYSETALAIRLLGLEDAWGADNLLFQYVERWKLGEPWSEREGGGYASWLGRKMFDALWISE